MKDVKIAGVQFQQNNYGGFSGNVYDYYTTEDLTEGDICVVKVDERFAFVRVCNIERAQSQKVTKFIIQKVDMFAYEENVRKLDRIRELKKLMDKRFREVQDIALYERLAETDVVMAGFVAEMKELEG